MAEATIPMTLKVSPEIKAKVEELAAQFSNRNELAAAMIDALETANLRKANPTVSMTLDDYDAAAAKQRDAYKALLTNLTNADSRAAHNAADKINNLTTQIETLTAEIATKQKTITTITAERDALTAEIADLKAQLAEKQNAAVNAATLAKIASEVDVIKTALNAGIIKTDKIAKDTTKRKTKAKTTQATTQQNERS